MVKMSLHIGVDKTDKDKYGYSIPELKCCKNDAIKMSEIVINSGFISQTLLDGEATVRKVSNTIIKIADVLSSGDDFLLTYSGHGTQIPDLNNDETDNLDEAYVLYDKLFLDDEFNQLLTRFKEDVNILILVDSCHSGTITRNIGSSYGGVGSSESYTNTLLNNTNTLIPKFINVREYYEENKAKYSAFKRHLNQLKESDSEIRASVGLISACQDNQVALEDSEHGVFTNAIIQVINSNLRRITPNILYRKVTEITSDYGQTPNFVTMGQPSPRFNRNSFFIPPQKPQEVTEDVEENNSRSTTVFDNLQQAGLINQRIQNEITQALNNLTTMQSGISNSSLLNKVKVLQEVRKLTTANQKMQTSVSGINQSLNKLKTLVQ
jgi:hypothetical protein